MPANVYLIRATGPVAPGYCRSCVILFSGAPENATNSMCPRDPRVTYEVFVLGSNPSIGQPTPNVVCVDLQEQRAQPANTPAPAAPAPPQQNPGEYPLEQDDSPASPF